MDRFSARLISCLLLLCVVTDAAADGFPPFAQPDSFTVYRGGTANRLDSGNDIAFSVDLLDTGSAPIDTGFSLSRGRVAGEFEDHYSLLLDFTFNWR